MEIGMAQKIRTLFVDDLDGSEAEGTVHFGLDGTQYEIDLSPAHAKELRAALARYTEAARKISGTARRPARRGRSAAATGTTQPKARDWAKAQGIEIKDRGRVPADVMVKFQAATSE
jgi:hypothetical protein